MDHTKVEVFVVYGERYSSGQQIRDRSAREV